MCIELWKQLQHLQFYQVIDAYLSNAACTENIFKLHSQLFRESFVVEAKIAKS